MILLFGYLEKMHITNLILVIYKGHGETKFYSFYLTLEKNKCCNNTMSSENIPFEPGENDNLQKSNPEV